jgi:hypothetical protein
MLLEGVDGLDRGAMQTDSLDGDTMQMNCLDDDAHLCETLSAEDNNTALLGMFYHDAQVPQLIKIAIQAWFMGMRNYTSYMQITENFEGKLKDTFWLFALFSYFNLANVEFYYQDACERIFQQIPVEFAQLFLACSVNFLSVATGISTSWSVCYQRPYQCIYHLSVFVKRVLLLHHAKCPIPLDATCNQAKDC